MKKKRTINKYDIADFDYKSKTELQKELKRLTNLANSRLRNLEKSGYTQHAYRYASKALGKEKPRYKARLKTSRADLRFQIGKVLEFINKQTSTITGEKEVLAKSTEWAESIVGEDRQTIDDFFDFLSSQQFKDLSKVMDSNQVVEMYSQNIKSGATKADMQKAFSEFQSGRLNNKQVAERMESARKACEIRNGNA